MRPNLKAAALGAKGNEKKQPAKRWEKRDTEYRQNEDGSKSTHKMAYAEDDTGAVAFPTVFPKDRAGTKSHNPKDWMELDGRAAIDTASARGEIYKFNNAKNAKKWAEGGYKKNK
jgi:hypothetical protein